MCNLTIFMNFGALIAEANKKPKFSIIKHMKSNKIAYPIGSRQIRHDFPKYFQKPGRNKTKSTVIFRLAVSTPFEATSVHRAYIQITNDLIRSSCIEHLFLVKTIQLIYPQNSTRETVLLS